MGWSHGRKWTEEQLLEELLNVYAIIRRVPTEADLKSLKRQDLIQAIRRRGGLRLWKTRLSTSLLRMHPCGDETPPRQPRDRADESEPQSCLSAVYKRDINKEVDLYRDSPEALSSYSLANDDSKTSNDDSKLTNDDSDLTEVTALRGGDRYSLANDDSKTSNDDSKLTNDDSDLAERVAIWMRGGAPNAESSYSLANDDSKTSNDDSKTSNDDFDLLMDSLDLTEEETGEPLLRTLSRQSLANDDSKTANDDSKTANDDSKLTESKPHPVPQQFEPNSSNIKQVETNLNTRSTSPAQSTEKKVNYFELMKRAGLPVDERFTRRSTEKPKKAETNNDPAGLDGESADSAVNLSSINSAKVNLTVNSLRGNSRSSTSETRAQESLFEHSSDRPQKWTESAIKKASDRLFLVWVEATGKTRARLTPKKVKTAGARLRQGYSVEDLEHCLQGFASSPWHSGCNPQNKEWNDFVWCLKDGDKVEQGIGYYNDLVKRPAEAEQRKQQAEADECARLQREMKRRAEINARRLESLPAPVECTEIDEDELEELMK